MKKLLIFLLLLLSFARAEDINLDSLVAKAKEENRHILVYFHQPYCGYCKRMKRNTLDNDAVKAKISKDFIYVDINIRDHGTVVLNDFKGSKREFARYLDYDAYPSVVFIDKHAEMIYSQAGYQNEEYFLKILNYISSVSYEDMGIEEFKGVK
jgi:thioredoxin-related protein